EVYKVVQNIQFKEWVDLAAKQREITVGVRKPSQDEVKRAKQIMAGVSGPVMQTRDEIYARETVLMDEFPAHKKLVIQALRIGDLAITAIPAEVFVEIGLEIKQRSPFKPTFS